MFVIGYKWKKRKIIALRNRVKLKREIKANGVKVRIRLGSWRIFESSIISGDREIRNFEVSQWKELY